MQRRRVLFPDPDRPKMTTTSPSGDLEVDALQDLVVSERLAQLAHSDHRLGHAGSLSTISTPGWVVTLIVVRT